MKRRDVLTTTAAIAFAGCIGGSGGDGGTTDTSPETTGDSTTADIETHTDSTVVPTETETSGPRTVQKTETKTTAPTNTSAHSTSTATETATGPTDTPIPVPDRLTDHRKDTPLTGEAHVSFENGGSRVVVTGTIIGKNGCQTAVHSVRKTNSGLVITVTTERDASANAVCSMALVDIEYRFAVTVETPPESVTVIHRGMGGKRTMTTVKPDG